MAVRVTSHTFAQCVIEGNQGPGQGCSVRRPTRRGVELRAERRLGSGDRLHPEHGELVPGALDDGRVGVQVVRQGAACLVDRRAATTGERGGVDVEGVEDTREIRR